MSLVQKMFLHAVSVPALNKWTTVAPCVNLVTAMQHFCNVLPEAFGQCFPPGPQAEHSESEDEGQPLGAPLDQTKAWRKLARKRQRKSAQFVQDSESKWLTLLWSVCVAPVMVVHYSLFKRGTWLNQRPQDENAWAATTAGFANQAFNPAARAMSDLSSMLMDTVQVSAWQPLMVLYGPLLSWPQARLRTVRRSLLTEMGQLWRKLIEPWARYPWKLVDLPVLSEELQRVTAQAFFAARACCLDGFSAKLKAFVGTEERLLSPDILLFLQEVFDRVVPTSTFIERAFSRLNRWCDVKGPKPQLSTLAAKHATFHFRNLTDKWRKQCQDKGLIRKRNNRSRPDWAHGVRQGRAKNGLHIFAKEVGLRPTAGLMREWARLTPAERGRYSRLARAENTHSKALARLTSDESMAADELTGGFWQMSSSTGFPMARHIVAEKLDDLRHLANTFKVSSRSLQADDPEIFDGAPATPFPLWAGCSQHSCPHSLSPEARQFFNEFHEMFLEVILRKGPNPSVCSQEPLVLSVKSETRQTERWLVVAYNTRKKPIEVALMELKLLEEDVPENILFSLKRLARTHSRHGQC